jgi:glycosyltransferase involved in cell wall biosynthesis
MPISVSACIICRNAGTKIVTALDSLTWCADIVIVDSGSTDDTLTLARAHSAIPRVLHHAWPGYNPQRQFAAEQCLHDWVLMLDADEECSPQLATQIATLDEAATRQVAIYRMPRRNYVAKRYVRCWSPDYQTRLIHRRRITWDPTSAPEIRRPLAGFSINKLAAPLLHNRLTPFSATDVNDGPRMAEHAEVLARAMMKKKSAASVTNLLFRPFAAFFKYYILRGAFLDGRFGLVIAYKSTIGVILKYSVLYGKQELAEPDAEDHGQPTR